MGRRLRHVSCEVATLLRWAHNGVQALRMVRSQLDNAIRRGLMQRGLAIAPRFRVREDDAATGAPKQGRWPQRTRCVALNDWAVTGRAAHAARVGVERTGHATILGLYPVS